MISTSALELGIDIGDLDLCILVGYPGSIVATWQRGGRVGRGGQDSALVIVAGEDALDQYFMRNPEDFFARPVESVTINPLNTFIAGRLTGNFGMDWTNASFTGIFETGGSRDWCSDIINELDIIRLFEQARI